MGLRVKDGGGSEGRPVMGQIGVAPTHTGNITPRESGQTSTRSLVTRNLMGTQIQEFVERGAAARTAGASLRTVIRQGGWRSLQSIVKVGEEVCSSNASCDRDVSPGLSRVR